jgi:hypothetical protein
VTPSSPRRVTGICGLASVGIWLAIFPLYLQQPPASLYDGAATAAALASIRTLVFTRILLGLALYVTMLIFAVGLRELIRQANAAYEWVGTVSVVAMGVWLGVTLVANGLEGGAVLDTLAPEADPSVVRALTLGYLLIYNGAIAFIMTALYLATAGYASVVAGVLPQWTGWLAAVATVLCVACIPAIYAGPADPARFYNVGGWGAAIIANFPPLVWFLAVSLSLLRSRAPST